MDLHHQLIARARRQVLAASWLGAFLGGASLVLALRTWSERGYLDFQIIFGIADSLLVLGLAIWLRRLKATPAILLVFLGMLGIAYTIREGAPLIALIPTAIAVAFYTRAVGALTYLDRVRDGTSAG